MSRALRTLLLANDGMSAGHVARAIAIARALQRRGAARDVAVRIVLATTSTADALLVDETFCLVRLPPPALARRAGFSDAERRRLVSGVLEGLVGSFGPDLFVTDTFPSGPHGELANLDLGNAKRVLVRRAVPDEREGAEALTTGLERIDLAIVADDPSFVDVSLPVEAVRVPPITIGEASEGVSRDVARARLALPATGQVLLVASGGGGDPDAVESAIELASSIARLAPNATVVRAVGPLERTFPASSGSRTIHVAPLQPFLPAFDGVFTAAGYNAAHELAKAGVPAALFACPRAFDDQAARAARFAAAGLAWNLERRGDEAIAAALAWMITARPTVVAPDGADRAADVLLDLVTRPAKMKP